MITLFGFIKKEFCQALRDRRMKVLLFVMPMVQLTLFGVALSTEVRNIRTGFIYPSLDDLSRKIHERAIASGWFVEAHAGNDPFESIQSGRLDAVVISPAEGLKKAAENGRGDLQLMIDASNALRSQNIERYVKEIIRETMRESEGIPANPIDLSVRLHYNPAMESAVFMVPGVMCMIVCILTIILTSMAVAREKEAGTFELLISAPVSRLEIILGKTIPYFILGISNIPLIIATGAVLFGVPVRGPIWALAVASIAFVATTVSIGILISTFAKNQQQAMMGGFLFQFPAIMLSGVMFPTDNMPWVMRMLVWLNPLSYFVSLIRNILLKGGDPSFVITQTGILVFMALLIVFLSVNRFRQTLE